MSGYLDYSGRDDVLSGGVRKIPVDTPAGRFQVWVKRVGNAPDLRVLLLHGGPGATHEYEAPRSSTASTRRSGRFRPAWTSPPRRNSGIRDVVPFYNHWYH